MEEMGTDLIEVEEVQGEGARELGQGRRVEDDLSSKVLTEKMVYLMQKISEYGYLAMPEVELIYANQSHAYKVLGILRDKELIGDFQTERTPRKAYFLKPKGYRTLAKFGALRLKRRFLPQHFIPFIFNHRLACAKVGLILEGHPLVGRFMPESLLWERVVNRRQKLCDGEFVYRAPGEEPERVGLEVELTLKNRDMLDQSLRALGAREDLKQVWWICGDRTILRALASEVAARPGLKPQRHYFCSFEDFLTLGRQAKLRDHEGAEFSIDPAGPTLQPPKPEPPPPPPPPNLPEPPPASPPVARAEALAEPKPAPRLLPTPRLAWVWELCRLLWEALTGIAIWLGESWEKEKSFDGYLWQSRWRFRRWTQLYLAMIVMLGLTSLDLWTMPDPPLPPPPKPAAKRAALWRKQHLARAYFPGQSGWMIDKLALRSRGLRHRLTLEAINLQSVGCELKKAVLSDSRRQGFKTWDLGPAWVASQSGASFNLEFDAPPQEKDFLLAVRTGGSIDCNYFEVPIEVR